MKSWGFFLFIQVCEYAICVLYYLEAMHSYNNPVLQNLAKAYLVFSLFFSMMAVIAAQVRPESEDFKKLAAARATVSGKIRSFLGRFSDVCLVAAIAMTSPWKAVMYAVFMTFVWTSLDSVIARHNEAAKK